jgi:hypothetical protein
MQKKEFQNFLRAFRFNQKSVATVQAELTIGNKHFPVFVNEFWTAQQRQANAIHEVSYRACFKPQLPRFFIELFTKEGDTVYDPFNGRGTTTVEASLLNRNIVANDVNPLSLIFTRPRIAIPSIKDIEERLAEIKFTKNKKADIDLSMFYEKETLAEIVSLRNYLNERLLDGREDDIDRWIRMVATNRLTGHSPGFFSVYTLPPNQAVTAERQKKINATRSQKPDYRDVKKIILKKSKALMRDVKTEKGNPVSAQYFNCDAAETKKIKTDSVSLTVTSPPFLDVVQYAADNWLRCWFNNIDMQKVEQNITMSKTVEEWSSKMQKVFNELYRITKPNGVVAFEVGEVRNGKIKLEEAVVPLGLDAGFSCEAILINEQIFTKTANIWGVNNNSSGTNSNRIVVFRK